MRHHDPHEIYETRSYNALRRLIDWCVSHRVIVVLATVAAFAAAVAGFAEDAGLEPVLILSPQATRKPAAITAPRKRKRVVFTSSPASPASTA